MKAKRFFLHQNPMACTPQHASFVFFKAKLSYNIVIQPFFFITAVAKWNFAVPSGQQLRGDVLRLAKQGTKLQFVADEWMELCEQILS